MPGALFFKKSLARLSLPYQAHSASDQYESQRGPFWVDAVEKGFSGGRMNFFRGTRATMRK
jgi:hypothetical protein